VGDPHRVCVGVRHIRTGQGIAGGVEMLAAPVNPCLGPYRSGQLATSPITALGVDRIERTAELQAVDHRRGDALTTQPAAGCVGKELGCQG